MKFKHDKKSFLKNVKVLIAKSGKNRMIQISYDTDNCGMEAYLGSHGSNGKTTQLVVYISQSGKFGKITSIALIPETVEEKRLVNACFAHVMQADYCDTQIWISPQMTVRQWEKGIKLKRV